MISAKARQIFYNDAIYFPVPDIVHHAGKLRALKIRPGYIVIAIHIKYADIRILACKIPKKLNLVANGVSFSFSFIFNRDTGIQSRRIFRLWCRG